MSTAECIRSLLCFISFLSNEIGSEGVKRGVEHCYFRTEADGERQEFCNINSKLSPAIVKYFEDRHVDSHRSCKTFDLSHFDKNSPTIVYTEAQGRLGNQLLKYALIYQLGAQLDVTTYIDYDMKEQLTQVFTPTSVAVPVLYDEYCNPEAIPFEMWRGKLTDLLSNTSLRKGRFLWIYRPIHDGTVEGGYRPEDHSGPEQEAFFQAVLRTFTTNLNFHPHLLLRVKEALKKVANEMHRKPEVVTFVGVHNRRTDLMDHIRKNFKTSDIEELGVNYFKDAFDYFRDQYDNVAFIYASDDMAWGYQNLKSINDLHFLGAGQILDADKKQEGINLDATAFDFALLVNCNHTIITRGTFSTWIALLAGGEYYSEYGPIVPSYLL